MCARPMSAAATWPRNARRRPWAQRRLLELVATHGRDEVLAYADASARLQRTVDARRRWPSGPTGSYTFEDVLEWPTATG